MQALVELTRFLTTSQDIGDALQRVVGCVLRSLPADLAALLVLDPGAERARVGACAPAECDPPPGSSIDVRPFADVQQVLRTGLPYFAEARTEPHLGTALGPSPEAASQRDGLAPIAYDGRPHALLYARLRSGCSFDEAARAALELIANAAGMLLRNVQTTESLLYEKRQITEQQARAEHRLRFFQRYADFFESAADGMVVVDGGGTILFANPRACEIAGYSASELTNAQVRTFLGRREIVRIADLVRGFGRGVYPRGVDVHFRPKPGTTIEGAGELTLSVTFSPVLRAERALLVSFRDVTAERATEVELRRTTEFLERVIDSSVDAIVSSDMSGRVLLFNRAAARIFGYEPAEVIGKLSVEKLYPAGVAREVMREIRSSEHGGPRRLEDYRVDMLSKNGEIIPVNISAALIMDKDKAIGSVGVFTDVREKLRMEARLQTAREELRQQEKSLALAELAGTTAHELNQPLTSVIGYAELIMRQLSADSPLFGAAETILAESLRMANIVKKIGRITRYETRSYLGDTKILDLDKAAPDSQS